LHDQVNFFRSQHRPSRIHKSVLALPNQAAALAATIESPFPREGKRTFRYAPLSAVSTSFANALADEIATIQSTAIDRDTGLIKLTTTQAQKAARL
jgi:hypothetical protein